MARGFHCPVCNSRMSCVNSRYGGGVRIREYRCKCGADTRLFTTERAAGDQTWTRRAMWKMQRMAKGGQYVQTKDGCS